MSPFSELTVRAKAVEVLRWVGVVPAAVLGEFAVRYASGMVCRLAAYGWGTAAHSNFVYYLQLFMLHFPNEAAGVIAGAKMAPWGRRQTAAALAFAGIIRSLAAHILLQPHPGITNYTHFALETTGALVGVAYLFYSEEVRSGSKAGEAVGALDRGARAEAAEDE